MATWTDVSSTVLEPGDPIRSVDIIAIKENVIALSEGASGAPKILTAAINDAAVTTAKLATNERITTANVLAATAGASAGDVGTYAYLGQATDTVSALTAGSLYAGSGLRYGGHRSLVAEIQIGTTALAGTWRALGTVSSAASQRRLTLFLRIS